MAMTSPAATSDVSSAICLARTGRPRGTSAISPTPTSGTTAIVVSQGKSFISEPHQQEGNDDQDGATEHGQGVGANEAGLQSSDPAGGASDQRGQPVDDPVETLVLEEDKQPGEVLAQPHEQCLVYSVAVEISASGDRDEGDRRRRSTRDRAAAVLRDREQDANRDDAQRQAGDNGRFDHMLLR